MYNKLAKVFVLILLIFSLSAPALAARTRKLTVNSCGYVLVSETTTFKHANIISVDGLKLSQFGIKTYNSQQAPSCRKGKNGGYLYVSWQRSSFRYNNKLYLYLNTVKGMPVNVVYAK